MSQSRDRNSNKIEIRTEEQLSFMRISGGITAKALKKTLDAAKPGVTLQQLEDAATAEIEALGGQSSFKTVPGYRWTTCLNINDEVVHGIPREIILKEGDVLKIDLGAVYKGWHTDAAWSKIIGRDDSLFLKIGQSTLDEAIAKAVEGNRIGDISSAIQKGVEGAGYAVVKNLTGHGVGRQLHEPPEIPGYGRPGTGIELKSGMTIAIEVIYTSGNGKIYQHPDGWTLAASDGSTGGLFEMSVIVGKNTPEILTDWRTVG